MAAGFEDVDRRGAWEQLPQRGVVVEDGAVIAWHLSPGATPSTGFRIIGAHTDSPCLRIKPQPDVNRHGWRQLGVEVYGGALLNSWLDRDLGVAGRVMSRDGQSALIDIARPVARVPQLAIHLDRGVNDQGLRLDPQQHLMPVWGSGDAAVGDFAEWLEQHSPLEDLSWWELSLFDLQPASIIGADDSLIASGRLDNLVSCWAATDALIQTSPTSPETHHRMVVLNDHEEVGSQSVSGASGPLLEQVLERLVIHIGGDRDDLLRAFASSVCVSTDNAHALHPNYPERHDPEHAPLVNRGPAIKVNSNQRYATSASSANLFEQACRVASVPSQTFVSRNNMPCGSTIGPLTATRLGIATVDVGVPQLSMHSARELCGVDDPVHLRNALIAYFIG
jgi:aspartyl aminopeptidase